MNGKQLVKTLKAIGNDRRLAILKHLRVREMSVGQISKLIKLSFRSTSKHLMVLSGAGLVEAKQDNLNRVYFISPDFPKKFLELLS
jgi:DNA-binding transcriptional ArsR family regulator